MNDFITIASASLVAIGWFVTGYLNRRNNIALKRLEYRISAFRLVIEVLSKFESNAPFIEHPELTIDLKNARIASQLFFFQDEYEMLEDLIQVIESNQEEGIKIECLKSILNRLILLVRNRVRHSLALGNIRMG
jgi:hypothetical protein